MATTNNNKVRLTKSMKYEEIIRVLNGEPTIYGTTNEGLIEFINHEMELLARKNSGGSGEKKMTTKQKENESYKALILDFLAVHTDGATCTDMIKGIPVFSENAFSNQKVSALVRQLKLSGQVVATEVKGKTLFTLA